MDSVSVSNGEYLSKRTKRIITHTVVIVHLAAVLLPFLFFLFVSWMKPETFKVAKVVLVDSAPNDNKIPSKHPGPSPIPNNDDQAAPALPKNLDPLPGDIPPLPVMPRKPDKPKKTEKPRKIPKKTDTSTKKIPTKQPERPPKKTQKYLNPEDIKITPNQSSQRRTSNSRTPSNNRNQQANQSLDRLVKDLQSGLRPAGGAGGPLGEYDPSVDDYYARVGAFLRSRWTNQPNISALGGRTPTVRVYFTIDGYGRIVSKRINRCGISAMDVSVESLVRTLNSLPPPPKGRTMTFYVNMRIDN